MKKTLIIASFVAVLAIPSVTLAAWYNPFSWFRKAPVSVVVPVETVATQTATAPVALPAPKPVFTNTITVENPKLQLQINDLVNQNTKLQAQVVTLTGQYNNLVEQNKTIVAHNIDLVAQLASTKAALGVQTDDKSEQDKEQAARDAAALVIKNTCTDPMAVLEAKRFQASTDHSAAYAAIKDQNKNSGGTSSGAQPQYAAEDAKYQAIVKDIMNQEYALEAKCAVLNK